MVGIKTRLSRSRSRYHQSLTSPRKRSVSPTKPHTALSVLGVRSASRPRVLTENTPNSWGNAEHIPVIEFDYAFATDTLGDPNKKCSMMVATRSCGKEKRWPGRLCDAEFAKLS